MDNQMSVMQTDIKQALISAGVESVLPQNVTIEKFVQCASMAIMGNNDLQKAERNSMIMSLTKCANDGLVPDNKEAAIVTFNTKVKTQGKPDEWVTKAQYLPMIDGVIKRARMSGQVALLSSKAVYDDDVFRYWMDENGEHINYEPMYKGGNVRLVFAFAKLTTGELLVEVMTKADVDKVRAASKTGKYGPWADWYERMACKAVMHRLARRLPNASELVAMCEQGMNMAFDHNTEKEIQHEPVVNPHDKLKALLADKNESEYLPWLGVESIDDLTDAAAAGRVKQLENAKQ